jgi:hypothetical protein
MKVLEGVELVPDISIAPDYSTLNKDKTSKKQSRGQSSGALARRKRDNYKLRTLFLYG